MKIIATTRTRNEADNIDRFCQCYAWADLIIVADGGSTDDTVKRAKSYENVVVKHFDERVERNGQWRNPHGKHINFCIDIAMDYAADWVIFDDCDCVPTVALQSNLRDTMEATNKDVIMLYRLYVYGESQHFPKMNEPGQSIYAWRPDTGIRAWEGNPWKHRIINWSPEANNILRLERPLACLHYFCPDEETIQRKLDFYHMSLEQPHAEHPRYAESNGPLKLLPDWAKWKE